MLRPVYDSSAGVDGRVSLEVDPRLASDTEQTIAEAQALWWMVDRPNLFIKIPATAEGVPAITATPRRGDQRQRDADLLPGAVQRGHRRVHGRPGAGRRRPGTTSRQIALGGVVLRQSRVDTEVDKRLDKIGTPEALALRGKAAIANARLAYELYEQKLDTDRWRALAAKGAKVQRPLWASTSTKDPAFPDTLYVVELVAADTVNTMPEATLRATADHGDLRGDTIHGTYEESRAVFAALEALGIGYDDVVQVLEDEGVSKFEVSWNELLETIKNELSLNS